MSEGIAETRQNKFIQDVITNYVNTLNRIIQEDLPYSESFQQRNEVSETILRLTILQKGKDKNHNNDFIEEIKHMIEVLKTHIMWIQKHSDIKNSIEYIVLKPEYKELFDKKTLTIAENRVNHFNDK